MHRTNRVPSAALWSVLLGLSLATVGTTPLPAGAQGQPRPADPQKPADKADKADKPAARGGVIILPINGTQRLQMSTRRPISEVQNPSPVAIQIQQIDRDPTAVLAVGRDAGQGRVTLIDDQGNRETFDIVVQFDVEYLRTVLRRAVPTAAVEPIPAANNTILLTGVVSRSEDVDIILRTTASIVGDPNRVVNGMRVGGVMQVQLDVVVAQVSRNEVRRLSFEFANFGFRHVISNGFGGLILPANAFTGTFPAGPITFPNAINPVNGAPINTFLAVFTPDQDFFGFLQALRDENVVKIMAQPRLTTLSGQRASLLSGGEQAVPVPAGLGQVGIQFEEFGTRLNFLPVVLGNGRIHLEVEPEVSTLDQAAGTVIQGTAVAGRNTQRVHTTVELEDGQTFAIGGLISRFLTNSTRKVPVLGDLPFIGTAFSQKFANELESELLVLVTPHLVDGMSCDQAPKILPGQESRNADDFELFLEGILEAPRGPRVVCPNDRYRPAFRNGPTAALFPCAKGGKKGYGANGSCGNGGCDNGCQPAAHPASVPPAAPPVQAPPAVRVPPTAQPVAQQAPAAETPATTPASVIGGENPVAPASAVEPAQTTPPTATPPATPEANAPASEAPSGENRPVVIPPATGGNPGQN
jgi:pilus assembly protein CpaC